MSKKLLMIIGLIFSMAVSSIAVDSSCMVDLRDTSKLSHVSVETCTNIGTFSIGTYQDNRWQGLTYHYPKPWKGTYLTLRVDGKIYSNSIHSINAIHLDDYVREKPESIGSDGISMKWALPEGIDVEQIIKLVNGGASVHVKITNSNRDNINVDMRLSLDIMVGDNDGASIYVPKKGDITRESVYSDSTIDFNYLIAQDKRINPTLKRRVYLDYGSEIPNKIAFTNWKTDWKSTSWEYSVDPSKSTELDSAIILYYGPKTISPGQLMELGVYYGKRIAPTCSDGVINQNETDRDCGGPCAPCMDDKSCLVDSDCESSYCYGGICTTPSCFDMVKNQDETDVDCGGSCKPCSIEKLCDIDSDCESKYCHDGICKSSPITRPETIFIFAIMIPALLLIVLVYARKKKAPITSKTPKRAVPVKPERAVPVKILPGIGKVIASKFNTGNTVTLAVSNKSNQDLRDCRVEDEIPENAKIVDISGNADIKKDTLLWLVGNIISGKKKSMDYTIDAYTKKLPSIKNISFLSQELVKAEILRSKK